MRLTRIGPGAIHKPTTGGNGMTLIENNLGNLSTTRQFPFRAIEFKKMQIFKQISVCAPFSTAQRAVVNCRPFFCYRLCKNLLICFKNSNSVFQETAKFH